MRNSLKYKKIFSVAFLSVLNRSSEMQVALDSLLPFHSCYWKQALRPCLQRRLIWARNIKYRIEAWHLCINFVSVSFTLDHLFILHICMLMSQGVSTCLVFHFKDKHKERSHFPKPKVTLDFRKNSFKYRPPPNEENYAKGWTLQQG